MKWGVRKEYKPVGKRASKSDNEPKERKKLTRKQKAVIIGTAVVAAYATYKFVDSGSATRLIAKGKEALGHTSIDFNTNSKLSSKTMDSDEILSSVVSRINPNYGDIGTKNNCRRCTFAYEMSRRGYDVKATKSISATGQNIVGVRNAITEGKSGGLLKYFKEAVLDTDSFSAKSLNDGGGLGAKTVAKISDDKGYTESIFKALGKYENGARGELTVKWSAGGAHSMAWEIVKNKPVIFDCQTGKKYDTPDLFRDLGNSVSNASLTRLDNLNLNTDFLLRWLQNA